MTAFGRRTSEELTVRLDAGDQEREDDRTAQDGLPLVSVIVPVFNVEKYLGRCVDSLSAQTHSRMEIILVNDGSTDQSGDLCNAYSATDSRIRVIHQKNAGVSAARNAGTSVSQGDWVFFVDGDDWVSHDAVEVLLAAATRVNAEIAVGRFLRVGDDGVESPTSSGVEREAVLTGAESVTALLGPMHTLLTVAWGKLFKRELLSKLVFPVGRIHEDEFVSHRVQHAAHRVVVLPRPLYFYRQHSGSIMGAGFNAKKARDATDAYADRLTFLQEVGRTDLLPLARAQLFRKYMALFRGTSQGSRPDAALSQMRFLAREMRASRDRSAFVAFASAYAWCPHLIDPLYSAYNKRRTRASPGRASE